MYYIFYDNAMTAFSIHELLSIAGKSPVIQHSNINENCSIKWFMSSTIEGLRVYTPPETSVKENQLDKHEFPKIPLPNKYGSEFLNLSDEYFFRSPGKYAR